MGCKKSLWLWFLIRLMLLPRWCHWETVWERSRLNHFPTWIWRWSCSWCKHTNMVQFKCPLVCLCRQTGAAPHRNHPEVSRTDFAIWLEPSGQLSREQGIDCAWGKQDGYLVNHSCSIQLGRGGQSSRWRVSNGLLSLICLARPTWLKSSGALNRCLSETSATEITLEMENS